MSQAISINIPYPRFTAFLASLAMILCVTLVVLSELGLDGQKIGYGIIFVQRLLAGLWFLAFGASLGSFLNVVAYRLPRRDPIAGGTSRCPRCFTSIRFTDNVPLLGWIWLGGRCRACQLPISVRYPIVELIAAGLFGGLAWFELMRNADNLPEPLGGDFNVWWTIGNVSQTRLLVFAFHGWLLGTLLVASLIRFDGLRVPAQLWIVAGFVGLVLGAIFPQCYAVPFAAGLEGSSLRLTGVVGLVVGGVCGKLLGILFAGEQHDEDWPGVRDDTSAWSGGLIGAVLGWQAALLCIAVAVLLTALVGLLLGRSYRPWILAAITGGTAFLFVLSWSTLQPWISG